MLELKRYYSIIYRGGKIVNPPTPPIYLSTNVYQIQHSPFMPVIKHENLKSIKLGTI